MEWPADSLTDAHFAQCIAGIRKDEKRHSLVAVGNVAAAMLQLGGSAGEVNRRLNPDVKDGRIVNAPQAMALWSREYEKGWNRAYE